MIKSIHIFSGNNSKKCDFTQASLNKIELNDDWLKKESFSIQIVFKNKIVSFRNHDYNWVKIDKKRIANWYAPKIIRLDNNQLVQANQNLGIWEVSKKKLNTLLWHFNPKNANPIINYDANNHKHIIQSITKTVFKESLALLFPSQQCIEVSRSKIPFSAITCFTDHCDFDTLENLIAQRHFFKKHDIKTTKGFFLNHYSKREDTASYENHHEELNKWVNDGHELTYHSLSQSIKPRAANFNDFMSFEPPIENITTWIDHGFQQYNFTQYNSEEQIKETFIDNLSKKNIKHFWNYIDSGTAINGVINQINPEHFTLNSYFQGIKHLGFKSVFSLLTKDIIFHYFNSDYGLRLYRQIAIYFKAIKRKKSLKKHFNFVINIGKLMALLLPVFVFWRSKKNEKYPLAEFTPLVFDFESNGKSFSVFQTLEMIDFKTALSKSNIDLLIEESGLFIAHTYFSAPMNYHKGKLFNNKNTIDTEVENRFLYLSEKIALKEIWNPTLSELIQYMKKIEHATFDCNEAGEIFIRKNIDLISRQIK